MRIECPSCSAIYDLPEQQLAAGRPVRCARCSASWTPVPIQPQPALATTPLTAPPRPPRVQVVSSAPASVARSSGGRGLTEPQLVLIGWVLSIAALALIGWAAVTWRDEVMRAWPPSERVYAALGLVGPARP